MQVVLFVQRKPCYGWETLSAIHYYYNTNYTTTPNLHDSMLEMTVLRYGEVIAVKGYSVLQHITPLYSQGDIKHITNIQTAK